jgi:hypothetical protein
MLYSLAETKDSTSSTYSDNMDDNYITKVGRMIVQNGISCAITLEFLNLPQVWKHLLINFCENLAHISEIGVNSKISRLFLWLYI